MSCQFRLIQVVTSKQPCRRLQRCCRGLRHLFPLLLCSTLHLSQRSPSSVEPKRSRCQLRGAFGTYSVRPCASTKTSTCTSCTGIFEFNFLAASQLAWLTKPGDGINVDIGHCNFHEPATPQIWRQESLLLLYSEVVPNLLERQKHVENLGAWNASLAQSAKLCEGTFKLPKKTHLLLRQEKMKKVFLHVSSHRRLFLFQTWIRNHTPNIVSPCRGGGPKKVKLLADQSCLAPSKWGPEAAFGAKHVLELFSTDDELRRKARQVDRLQDTTNVEVNMAAWNPLSDKYTILVCYLSKDAFGFGHLQSKSASWDVLREYWNWESVVSLRWVAKGKEGYRGKVWEMSLLAWFAMPHSGFQAKGSRSCHRNCQTWIRGMTQWDEIRSCQTRSLQLIFPELKARRLVDMRWDELQSSDDEGASGKRFQTWWESESKRIKIIQGYPAYFKHIYVNLSHFSTDSGMGRTVR